MLGARLVSIKMQDPAGVPKRWGRRAGVPHPLAWAQVGKPPASLRSKGGKPRKPSPLQLAFAQNDFTAVPELARNGMPQVYNWLVTDPHRKASRSSWRRHASRRTCRWPSCATPARIAPRWGRCSC